MVKVAPFLPELLLVAGGLACLLLPVRRQTRWLGWGTLFLLVAALDLKLWGVLHEPFSQDLFGGWFTLDRFSQLFGFLILVGSAGVAAAVLGFRQERGTTLGREFFGLLLLATTALLIVAGARHLFLIYLGLEMVSLLSYCMTGVIKRDSLGTEAALKYFLFGALATGAFLYGLSWIYGLTGTLHLAPAAARMGLLLHESPWIAGMALFFVTVGVGFKLSLVPFHMWAPDAYEGAPTPVAAFLSIGPKAAAFAVAVRLFPAALPSDAAFWSPMLAWLAVLSMTIGNLAAVGQTNVKRLLAYSSIAHAGTMLIGIAAGSSLGLAATFYYLGAYLLMNLGAFTGVILIGNRTGREDLDAFRGLSRSEPAAALAITVCLLSLAGIPPLAGFFAKLWIFGAALQANLTWLAVAAALNAVVAAFYYMRIVQAMYLASDPLPAAVAFPHRRLLTGLLFACVIGLFAIGLFPQDWLTWAIQALPPAAPPSLLPW